MALAAIAFAHAFEAICNGRHKSWYLHLFVYLVPRQIARYGSLWPFSTAALESRGARIKRIRGVSWRGYCDKPYERKSERSGRVTIFKQNYRSSPTLHIMRMLASQEAMFHDGKGRGAARLSQTGRFKKVKMEADHAEGSASYELDPFAALSSFISAANVQAGGR